MCEVTLISLGLGLFSILFVTILVARSFGRANGIDKYSYCTGDVFKDDAGRPYTLTVDQNQKSYKRYLDEPK